MAHSASMFPSYLIRLFDMETTHILLFSAVTFYILLLISERLKKMNPKYPPGPMGLPFVGSLPFLGAEPHKAMLKLAKQYGNIFSLYLGSNYTVVLNDFESMKEGLSHPAALDRAPNMFDHIIGGLGFAELNGPSWKEQRRFCMQMMRDLGLGRGSWESIINKEISNFTKEVEALQGEPTDISNLLRSSVINNIVSLLIGRRLDKEKEKDTAKLFSEFSSAAFKNTGPSNAAILIPRFRKCMEFFKLAGYEASPMITKKTNGFLKDEIQLHKSSRETRDFIDRYLDQMEQNEIQNKTEEKQFYAFSATMLEGHLNAMFLGSSDTIFNSLTYIFRLLAAHPDVQQKIHQELDSVLGRDGKASYEDRRHTPYTFATILEMERYGTILPISTTRVVNTDYELGGYVIPKGAQIFGNIWAIHNDSEYWEKPEKFLPQRFLTENGSKLLPKLPKSYVPFSLGKRNCPGETVAFMETYLYLCFLMQKFQISTPPGEELNFNVINGLVIQLEPQKLCFTLREL